jgi:hypothetical protein
MLEDKWELVKGGKTSQGWKTTTIYYCCVGPRCWEVYRCDGMVAECARLITSDATIGCASNWLESRDGTMMMARRRRDACINSTNYVRGKGEKTI